jgi:hypothetical protein
MDTGFHNSLEPGLFFRRDRRIASSARGELIFAPEFAPHAPNEVVLTLPIRPKNVDRGSTNENVCVDL